MTERRARRRPAPLARIAIAGLSATSMFALVTLLAIRGQQAVTAVAAAPATAPPRQVVVYVTDPPVGAPDAPTAPGAVPVTDPATPAASGDPVADVAAGGTPDGGTGADPGVAAPAGADPVASPAPAPVAATPTPTPAPAPAPATAPPAPTTGTGGS